MRRRFQNIKGILHKKFEDMSAPYVDRMLNKLTSSSFQSDFNKAQMGNMNTFNNWGEWGTFMGLKAYNKLTEPRKTEPKQEESDIFRTRKNPLSAKETMDLLLPARFTSDKSTGLLPPTGRGTPNKRTNPMALQATKYGLPERHVAANKPTFADRKPRKPRIPRKPKYVDVDARGEVDVPTRKLPPLKKNYVYRVNV